MLCYVNQNGQHNTSASCATPSNQTQMNGALKAECAWWSAECYHLGGHTKTKERERESNYISGACIKGGDIFLFSHICYA